MASNQGSEIDLLVKAKAQLGAAQAEITRFLEGIETQSKKTSKELEHNTQKAGGFAGALGNAVAIMGGFVGATAIMGGLGAAFGLAKEAAFGMNAQLETTKLKFATLMGDAALAEKHVKGLFEFAKKTPFETGPIIEASLKLQTFGGAALNTKENLTLLGDASAATGAPIQELGFWVGRMYAMVQSGKPFGEAAMRLQELAVLTPQARDEMERLQKSGASSAEVFGAFQKQLGSFTGAMEKQAGTWSGLMSTISDSVMITLAEALQPLFEVMKAMAKLLVDGMETDGWEQSMDSIKESVKLATAFLLDFGDAGISVAEVVYRSFKGLQAVFDFVAGSLVKVNQYFFKLIEGLAAVGAHIPGVGNQFEKVGAQAKDVQTFLGGAADGFFSAGKEAMNAALGVGEGASAFDKMHAAVQAGRDAVNNAGKALEQVAGTAKAMPPALAKPSKSLEELAKKMKEMAEEAQIASRNGRLQEWAIDNADALNKLASRAADAGQKLQGLLAKAFVQGNLAKANEEAAKLAPKLLEQQAEAQAKAVERMNDNYIKGLDIRMDAEKAALDISRKRTMSDYEYKKAVVEDWRADQIRELEAVGQATDENLAAVEAAYAEKMGEAARAHNDAVAKMKAETNSWGNLTQKWLAGVPDMIKQAFTGGGGLGGALKGILSGVGGDVGDKIFGGPNGLGNKLAQGLLGKGMGGALSGSIGKFAGMLGGPLGSMLGGVAGNFIGKLFGGDKNTKEIKALSKDMTELAGGIENIRMLSKATGVDMEAAFRLKGAKGLEEFKQKAEEFKQKVGELREEFGEWAAEAAAAHVKLPASLQPYLAQLEKMGVLTAEHRAELEKWSQDGQVDVEAMKAAADRYGVSLAALGPAFQQGVANQNWQQVIDDLKTFEQGGADMIAVLDGMSDEISKLVQDSIQFGTTIPENMRPWVEKLIESGKLVDANGQKITDVSKLTFGDKLVATVEKLIAKFDVLLRGLGLIPPAIDAIPNEVNVDVNFRTNGMPEVPEGIAPGEFNPNGEMPELPGMAAGGIVSKPTFRVVGESGPEVVGSPNVIVDALAQAMKQTGMPGGGAGAGQVNFNLTTSIATVDSIRQMWYEEIAPVMLQWLEDNRGGGRTSMQQSLGVK